MASRAPATPDLMVDSAERAILVLRWVALASVVLNMILEGDSSIGRNPTLAYASSAAVGAWTIFLTRRREPPRGWLLAADVLIGALFLVVSALVMPYRAIEQGAALLSVTYQFCPILSAAAAYGPAVGGLAGLVMMVGQLLVRTLNGLSAEVQRQLPSVIGYVLLGLIFGVVANLLRRSSEEARRATAEALAAREREARLAERASMAREIHDSALQVLALIHKEGERLAALASPPPSEMRELAEMARDQEAALRSLILREPDEAPAGEASLRSALERVARQTKGIDVSVSAVGPVWLPGAVLEELVAAVREALANVVEHAGASRAAVFADAQDGLVEVSVRDDGVGFEFDEARFRAEGKFGVLNSMRGRVEALGGRMDIESRPGLGTEVEFRVPVATEEAT